MYTSAQYEDTRREIRRLRIDNSRMMRAHKIQKDKNQILEEEINRLRKEKRDLEREKGKLEKELEKTKRERDTYKGMIFKAKIENIAQEKIPSIRKRGGQLGHKGRGREKPLDIDKKVDFFLTNCPACDTRLEKSNSFDTHTATDLPHWELMKPVTSEYSINRQWCPKCGKEVRACPFGVIPGVRLGINLLIFVLVWRYRFRDPFNKIVERLKYFYQLDVSEGALVDLLRRSKKWLGSEYDEILKEVRGSPVKHGDETGWRVGGKNWWCWIGVSQKSAYYTIEESRGGGIAKEIFEGSKGVLVRDDYRGYTALPLPQQSCWAHLLRKSHEAAEFKDASPEVKTLHQKLKTLFDLLQEDISRPFNKKERQELYGWYKEDIQKIINAPFEYSDTRRIQTRIRNQNTNLLTAILYDGVCLTNNPAEQGIRKIVVTRKISGGSQTSNGAKIHAVNMSVVETIIKRKLPLFETLQEYLLQGATGKN